MIYSLLIFFSAFFTNAKPPAEVPVISLEQLQAKIIHTDNDTLYIVNFWATWCRPCIAELPYFEKVPKQFPGEKVKVILVSLDLPSEKENLNTFIKNKNIRSDVYLLNAGDPNIWIDQIDPSWGGGIPTTVMYKNGKKVFFKESDFSTQQELDSTINTKIK